MCVPEQVSTLAAETDPSGDLRETVGDCREAVGRMRRRESGKGRRWKEEEEEGKEGLAGHLGTYTKEPFQTKH